MLFDFFSRCSCSGTWSSCLVLWEYAKCAALCFQTILILRIELARSALLDNSLREWPLFYEVRISLLIIWPSSITSARSEHLDLMIIHWGRVLALEWRASLQCAMLWQSLVTVLTLACWSLLRSVHVECSWPDVHLMIGWLRLVKIATRVSWEQCILRVVCELVMRHYSMTGTKVLIGV